jgi:hypothetical protein
MGSNPPQQPPGYTPQPPGGTPQPPYNQPQYGQPQYGQSPYGQPYPMQPKTSTLALIGFILSFTVFLSFIGVILCIVGLMQIGSSNGTQKGKGLAIAGIIIGGLFFVLGTIVRIANLVS